MTKDDGHARPQLGRIAANIAVRDIEKAVAFYRDVFGLEKTFQNGNPVGFVILKKDDAELHLSLLKTHTPRPDNVAHLMTSDADALHQRCVATGARIIKGLRDHDFGLRAFVFEDPDGNRIDVARRIVRPNS